MAGAATSMHGRATGGELRLNRSAEVARRVVWEGLAGANPGGP